MPQIGDIRLAKQIGRAYERSKCIWQACSECGKERWVELRKSNPVSYRCITCANKLKHGKNHPSWKGGRIKNTEGYIEIKVEPDDFFYPMAMRKGYVLEHRLVVAKAMGRNLHSWELVHHKRGFARDDNRYPETLQLVTDDRHKQITILENRIGWLEKRITLLEAENILLKTERISLITDGDA